MLNIKKVGSKVKQFIQQSFVEYDVLKETFNIVQSDCSSLNGGNISPWSPAPPRLSSMDKEFGSSMNNVIDHETKSPL